jgi:hypothetical protein
MFQRHMILDLILFHKPRIIRGCVNHHPNGPPLCLLFIKPLEILPFIKRGGDVACTAPLGNNDSMGRGRECCLRMGFFVGCKSWERKGALCEDGVFCWLQELGEEEGAVREWGFLLVAKVGRGEEGGGRKGIFMARGTHSAIIEKTAPEKIRVVVGFVQFKLIQF